jgi:hypothetical protein
MPNIHSRCEPSSWPRAAEGTIALATPTAQRAGKRRLKNESQARRTPQDILGLERVARARDR